MLLWKYFDWGKVGDTITATVEPSNATNVAYAWAADGTPIPGATTNTYTVGEADLGKKISVNVTGDSESKATAETGVVEAAEGTDIAIVSASQTAAKAVEIVFNKDASGVTITVTKDNKVAFIIQLLALLSMALKYMLVLLVL